MKVLINIGYVPFRREGLEIYEDNTDKIVFRAVYGPRRYIWILMISDYPEEVAKLCLY